MGASLPARDRLLDDPAVRVYAPAAAGAAGDAVPGRRRRSPAPRPACLLVRPPG